MSVTYDTLPTPTARSHRLHRIANDYFSSIGANARWRITQFPAHSMDLTVRYVSFRGPNADKAEFIFKLRGGVDALNKYLMEHA